MIAFLIIMQFGCLQTRRLDWLPGAVITRFSDTSWWDVITQVMSLACCCVMRTAAFTTGSFTTSFWLLKLFPRNSFLLVTGNDFPGNRSWCWWLFHLLLYYFNDMIETDHIFLFPSTAFIYKVVFEFNSVGACWKQLKTKRSHSLLNSF